MLYEIGNEEHAKDALKVAEKKQIMKNRNNGKS